MELGFEISEKKLEDIVCEHLNGYIKLDGLRDLCPGYLENHVYRQLDLGLYGRADIVNVQRGSLVTLPKITIIELKKGRVDQASLTQVMKYKAGLKLFIERFDGIIPFPTIETILIGGDISSNEDFQVAQTAIGGLSVYTYSIDNGGISFLDNCARSRYMSKTPEKISDILNFCGYETYGNEPCGADRCSV